MKKCYTLLLLSFLYAGAQAQIPEPTILFMEPRHGSGIDQINRRVHETFDGGFIVGISTSSKNGEFANYCTNTTYKTVLNKYKPDGYALEWKKCYGDEGNSDSSFGYLFPKPDGSFIVGGATGLSVPPTGSDFLIRKEDASGNILWGSKRYGGSAGEHFRDMIATTDGGYIAVLESNSNDGDVGSHYGSQFTFDIWILKVDSNGNKVWSTVLGGSQDERPTCVIPIPGGGCYVLAYTLSNNFDCITNHGNADVFVARLDSNGNKLWTKCFGGSGWDGSRLKATSVWGIPDGRGGAFITASTNSTDGDVIGLIGKGDFWLLNIDSAGIIAWGKCYGGPNTDEFPQTICKATDGSIWIGGTSTNQDGQVAYHYGGYDGWLVHTDDVGNFLSATVFGGPNTDEINLLQPLNDGLILVGGTYWAAGGTVPDTFAGGTSDVFLARVAPWTTYVSEQEFINDKIIAYPNPANTTLYISLKYSTRVRNLSIYDVLGKRVYKNSTIPDSIDVANWPGGIYNVQVKTAKETYSTKIIIQ